MIASSADFAARGTQRIGYGLLLLVLLTIAGWGIACWSSHPLPTPAAPAITRPTGTQAPTASPPTMGQGITWRQDKHVP